MPPPKKLPDTHSMYPPLQEVIQRVNSEGYWKAEAKPILEQFFEDKHMDNLAVKTALA